MADETPHPKPKPKPAPAPAAHPAPAAPPPPHNPPDTAAKPAFTVRWDTTTGAYHLTQVEGMKLSPPVALPQRCNETLEYLRKLSGQIWKGNG